VRVQGWAIAVVVLGVLSAPTSAAASVLPHAASVLPRAAGQPRQSQPLWLMKSNDQALLRRRAATDGVTLPDFVTWVGCGGLSDPRRCRPGQLPIYTSYWPLRRLALSGWQGTAVFDIEPWLYTPRAQRRDPGKFICLAAKLQNINPFFQVIITPYVKPSTRKMIPEDVAAARCGAMAVDLQSQFANGSRRDFGRFIRKAVAAIRRANPSTIILAGLATNNPRVQRASNLAADYHEALQAGVQGFWLNAKKWGNRNECTAAQGGPGCPRTGIDFLENIGLIGSK
jgi:hypothetical protein